MDLTPSENHNEMSNDISLDSGHGQILHQFTIDKIMSFFTKKKLTYLQSQFRKHCRETEEDGFELVKFVQLIQQVVPHKPDEIYDLIYGIYSLFREVDINGDGSMEWDEFVSYIIETADAQGNDLGSSVFQGHSSIQKVEKVMQKEETLPKYMHQNNLLLKAMAQKLPVFNQSKIYVDTLARNTPVQKALVYKKIDAIITLESNTRKMRVIKAMSNQAVPGIAQDNKNRTIVMQTIELHLPNEAYILSAAMNEQDGILAVTSTEGLMYFYKYSSQIQRFRVFKIICCCHIDGCQHQIWYLPEMGSFFTSGAKNILREWKISSKKRGYDSQAICEKCTNLFFPRRGSKILSQSIYENTTNFVERPFNASNLADSTHSYLIQTPDHFKYRDMIQDCIEMNFPYPAIITGCHDGRISLISKELNRVVGVLETGHQTGIRQLDYTPYHGGALISVGYEQFFNVWEMESSASFGKRAKEMPKQLKMIYYPVVAAKFLGNTFYVACVDQVNTVKIYNYKSQEIVQSLQQSQIRQQNITGIMVFSEGRFVLLGKKMVYYDNMADATANSMQPSHIHTKKEIEIRKMILNERGLSEMEQASIYQQVSQIQTPIDAIFVESYQTIIVLSKTNLRIYNTRNGRLIKIIENLGGDQSEYGELTSMCLDKPHRKLFIGDSRGTVRIFNVNSGVFMSELEISDEVKEKIIEPAGLRRNNELCTLNFFNVPSADEQNFMLITAQGSNRVSAWDVNDSENAELIRSLSGGKVFKEDVITIASSEHHSMIATGGVQGTICLWDFELFKLIGVLTGCRGGVCFLEFAAQFPLLVACTQLGVISVYTVRGAPNEIKNMCIARFVNLTSQPGTEVYINSQITCAMLRVYENPDYKPKSAEESKSVPQEIKKEKSEKVKFFKTELEPESEEEIFQTEYMFQVENYVLTFPPDHIRSSLMMAFLFQLGQRVAQQHLSGYFTKVNNKNHSHLFSRTRPPKNSEKPYIMHLFFGDTEGNIKLLDLSTFIRDPKPKTLAKYASMGKTIEKMAEPDSEFAPFFKQARPYHETKIGFMASRRLFNGVSGLGVSMKEQAFSQKLPTVVDITKTVLTKIIKDAHRMRINSIKAINVHPFGFISTSQDKHVKVWTQEGELCGNINLICEMTRLDNWQFGFDWEQQSREQLQKVRQIHKAIQEIEAGSEDSSLQTELNDVKADDEMDKSFDSKKSWGIKHAPFRKVFDQHPSLKHLLTAQQNTTYEAKKEQNKALFYNDRPDGALNLIAIESDSDHQPNCPPDETEEFNVDKVFPEEVWKSMINVEQEKQLIKNLTSDYNKFIKNGSIEEIKRNCKIQQSDNPKDKKLVQNILQRIEKKKTEQLEAKFQHRLSIRVGINLQKLSMGQPDSNTNRKNNDGSLKTEKQNSIQYQSSNDQTSLFTSATQDRQLISAGYEMSIVDQQAPIETLTKTIEAVPFSLKQYTNQSSRKIANKRNTIQMLQKSGETVTNQVKKSKDKTDKNISAIRTMASNLSTEFQRVRSLTSFKNSDTGRRVGFARTKTANPNDIEFQDLQEKLNIKAKQLQRIVDTKNEIESEKQQLKKMDPEFYQQLTERLSMKKLEEQHQKMIASASQQTLPSLPSHQKYNESTIFDKLKKEKFRFKRKPVVGLDSRNTNSKFLSRLEKFIDVSDRRFRVHSSIQPTNTIDSDATPNTLRKTKLAQSHKDLPTYQGDMMLCPGETARRIHQAFNMLNQQNYSQFNPSTSHLGLLQDSGKSIVRQVVEWKSIQRYRKPVPNVYESESNDEIQQTPGLEPITNFNPNSQVNTITERLNEDFNAPSARSNFIRKVALGQNKALKIEGLKDLQ